MSYSDKVVEAEAAPGYTCQVAINLERVRKELEEYKGRAIAADIRAGKLQKSLDVVRDYLVKAARERLQGELDE